jgi:arabinogalactan endo-1,4-beta-galactosidase
MEKAPRHGVHVFLSFHYEPDYGEWWTIQLSSKNFNSFSGEDRVVIFNWISDIIRTMRLAGIKVWPEKFEKAPEVSNG